MDNPKMNTLQDLFKNPRFPDFLLAYFTVLCIIYIITHLMGEA